MRWRSWTSDNATPEIAAELFILQVVDNINLFRPSESLAFPGETKLEGLDYNSLLAAFRMRLRRAGFLPGTLNPGDLLTKALAKTQFATRASQFYRKWLLSEIFIAREIND